jgi:integrase
LAKKIHRKKLSARDENRHLDIKREVNFRMSALIDRYWQQYGSKKKSQDREKAILEGIRDVLGDQFVREVEGAGIQRWYQDLNESKGLSAGTAVRHFNVMHHMMGKAATIWSKETGIDRNPADEVEVRRPDDQRERYLSAEEIRRLKAALDQKMYRKAGKGINQTFLHLRLIVLTALTTGMRIAEVFSLAWSDLLFREELVVVRAKLKGGKVAMHPCARSWLWSSSVTPRSWGRIGSCRQNRGRSANGRGWTRASVPSWSWPELRTSGFMTCGTPSPAGT